jgi:hypothetical protein
VLKYLTILIVCVASGCNSKVQRPEPSGPSTNPKIKQISESEHDPVRQENEVDHRSTISRNSPIITSTFYPNGLPESKSRFNSMGNLELRVTYKYDGLKRNTEIATYGPNGQLVQKKVNTFDASGNLAETSEVDASGRVTSREIMIDTASHIIRRGYQLLNGTMMKISERTFDEHGNNTLARYFLNGKLTQKDSSIFDASANRIETTEYHPAKNLEVTTRWRYDNNRNPVEVLVLKNNIVTTRTVSQYDSLNNVLETKIYGITGQVWTHKKFMYEFDQAGNWTEQVIMIKGTPSRVIVRHIIYY